MKFSVLMLEFNRLESFKKTFEHNINNLLKTRGLSEILVCDQGSSTLNELKAYLNTKPCVKYKRFNRRNEGTPRALNQLFLRSKGEYVAVMGNDILLPPNWAELALEAYEKVPNCGIVGFECAKPAPSPATINGYRCRPVQKYEGVFGDWVIKREVIEDVGAFNQDFHPYGLWDSEYNIRVGHAGYQSLYIDGHKSSHTCPDVGQKHDYRKMKDLALKNNEQLYRQRVEGLKGIKRFGYYLPFPPKI